MILIIINDIIIVTFSDKRDLIAKISLLFIGILTWFILSRCKFGIYIYQSFIALHKKCLDDGICNH